MGPFAPFWFVLGVLIGFFAEYLIDLWFWRRRLRAKQNELDALTVEMTGLQDELAQLQARHAQLNDVVSAQQAEIEQAAADAQTLRLQRDEIALQREAALARAVNAEHSVRELEQQLAQRAPAQQPEDVPLIDQLQTEIEVRLTELDGLRADNSDLQQLLDDTRQRAFQLQNQLQQAQRLLAQQEPSPVAEAAAIAQLQQIDGVDDDIAQRLHSAGITTFAQLAALAEAEILDIIDANAQREPDVAHWKVQAARLIEEGEDNG